MLSCFAVRLHRTGDNMICFFPVLRLRELGKRIEFQDLEAFNEECGYDSVQRTISGVFYRFFCDTKCPAMFLKIPKAGDEVVSGLRWCGVYDDHRILAIASKCAERCASKYGYDTKFNAVSKCEVLVIMKENFSKGRWDEYGYEYAGKNGISIPS